MVVILNLRSISSYVQLVDTMNSTGTPSCSKESDVMCFTVSSPLVGKELRPHTHMLAHCKAGTIPNLYTRKYRHSEVETWLIRCSVCMLRFGLNMYSSNCIRVSQWIPSTEGGDWTPWSTQHSTMQREEPQHLAHQEKNTFKFPSEGFKRYCSTGYFLLQYKRAPHTLAANSEMPGNVIEWMWTLYRSVPIWSHTPLCIRMYIHVLTWVRTQT